MGFLGFFFKSPIGIVLGFLSSLIMLAIVVVAVTGVLAFTGGPSACTPGGDTIVLDDANSQAFDQKWDQLDASLDSGAPTAISLSESEISSRADSYIRDRGGDVSEVRVCIHDGFGEVTGKVDAFVGDARFKVKGTVTLSGGHPVADFQDIEVGNVPGAVLGPFENAVEDAIQELLDDITLKHAYTPALQPGSAAINGTP